MEKHKLDIKILFVFYLVMVLTACKSPLSDGNLNDLSAIDARIEISQDLTNRNINDVVVLLYDENGKAIRNETIRMKVNGIPLAYSERQELYYNISSKYWARDINVGKEFEFLITLSNGKTYLLGKVGSLAQNKENNIVCPEHGDFSKDLIISWNNLKDIKEITINKSILLANSDPNQLYFDYEPVITRKIGSSGKLVIPKNSYVTSKATLSSVEINFNITKPGTMNSKLLDGSNIKISGQLIRAINFDEQSKK